MRCNNCGWNNAENASHCVKCNNPLELPRKAPALGSLPRELVACPNCKYPASSKVETCPMCGSPMKGGAAESPGDVRSVADAGRPGDALLGADAGRLGDVQSVGVAAAGSGPGLGASGDLTLDPFRQAKELESASPGAPVMWLGRAGRPGEEEKLLTFVAADNQVEVNRQSVDEDNYTITSRLQAAFVWKENKWWLVDKSELRTTFIQVREPVEVKDGDIVLMGDRRFVFYSTPPGAAGGK